MSDNEQRINAIVLGWLRSRNIDAAEVTRVKGYGTDWAGSTGEGFYAEFSVTIHYRDGQGRPGVAEVDGDAMASLWAWVVDHPAQTGEPE